MYSQLSLLISLHLFILPTEYHALSDHETFYLDCTKTFNCGEKVREIGYPFWGSDRPKYCGLEGLKLSCENDEEDFAMLDIGSDTKFYVPYIDVSSHEIEMKRYDILPDETCPQILTSAKFNETLFDYGQGSVDLHLFYNSTPPRLNISVPNNFTCVSQGIDDENVVFFGNESLLVQFPILHDCEIKVKVPVNRAVFEEFGKNEKMELQNLLNPSFVMNYRFNDIAFSTCMNSGGVSWSGIDSSSVGHTCLCHDGAYPYSCPPSPVVVKERKGSLRTKIGIGVGAALIGILLICFIYCIIKFSNTPVTFLRRKTKNDREVEDFIRQYGSSITKRYTYHEVKNMTNSFKHELGKGGYGNVFKGKLLDGCDVAVKVLNVSKGKGEEFINEVASIGRTSHVNVVTLLGFCYEGRRRALIYEFMPNGSLEKFIYAKISLTAGQHLGWEKLYDIALGIARGLNYLHRGCNTRIVHFDIKPHNILLDEDFCPKISDFGLAKLCTRKESIISTIEARGTIGYIAPEVFSRNFGGVSHKSDVYSYGMMVLEMVGGRKNVDVGVVHASEIYFPHWIYKRIKVDEELSMASEMTVEENVIARKMVIVGLWCIQTDPSQRPSISKAIEMLEGSISALEIPPKPYLCSPRRSASNSSSKALLNSPPGSDSNSFTTSN